MSVVKQMSQILWVATRPLINNGGVFGKIWVATHPFPGGGGIH